MGRHLSPHGHRGRGFLDDKDPFIVRLLVGGKNEKARSLRVISIRHAVHDFSVQEVHADLWADVIEVEVLHREDLMSRMVLVSLKGLDEENRFEKGRGYLDDLVVICQRGDVEAAFRWHEIRGVAFEDIAVSEMDHHLVLCHTNPLSLTIALVFSSIYSAPYSYPLNRKNRFAGRKSLSRHKGPPGSDVSSAHGILRRQEGSCHLCHFSWKNQGLGRPEASLPRAFVIGTTTKTFDVY